MAKKKVLIVGASGYGNVGDDTYRLMFQHYFAQEYDLLFCNSDIPKAFPKCDALIMGGGGLMYAHYEHFKKMVWYLKKAERAHIPYAFISVGYQFKPLGSGKWIQKPVADKWRRYVQSAQFVTVRSESDKEFSRHLGLPEERVFYFPDLCYGFTELVRSGFEKDPEKQICIVPGAGLFQFAERCSPAVWVQQRYTIDLIRLLQQLNYRGCKIVRMGAGSADNAKIRLIRELLENEHIPAYTDGNPKECLRQIAASEIVVSGRYHGMVFARAAKIPVMTMPAAPYKIWTEDKNLDMTGFRGHIDKMAEFLREV